MSNLNLYHVTLQIFVKDGALLINDYLDLPKPFFPEDAKKAIMQKNPGVILDRSKVILIQFSDQEENRSRLEFQLAQDKKMNEKISEVTDKAGRGEYGTGDEAAGRVKADITKIREDFSN